MSHSIHGSACGQLRTRFFRGRAAGVAVNVGDDKDELEVEEEREDDADGGDDEAAEEDDDKEDVDTSRFFLIQLSAASCFAFDRARAYCGETRFFHTIDGNF